MPPPLLLLALALLEAGGVELCALAGAAGELAGWVPGVLEVGDEPPQAVTNATSAADMIIRTRFVVMNLLHRVVRSAPGLSRTLPPSGSEKGDAPTGMPMYSWKSIEFNACAPPFTTFIIGTGRT